MDSVNENVIEWLRGDKVAAVTAPSGSKLKGTITRLAARYPEEVQVIALNQDGSIFAHVPVDYVVIRKPKQLSEAQRAAAMQGLSKARELLKTARD